MRISEPYIWSRLDDWMQFFIKIRPILSFQSVLISMFLPTSLWLLPWISFWANYWDHIAIFAVMLLKTYMRHALCSSSLPRFRSQILHKSLPATVYFGVPWSYVLGSVLLCYTQSICPHWLKRMVCSPTRMLKCSFISSSSAGQQQLQNSRCLNEYSLCMRLIKRPAAECVKNRDDMVSAVEGAIYSGWIPFVFAPTAFSQSPQSVISEYTLNAMSACGPTWASDYASLETC